VERYTALERSDAIKKEIERLEKWAEDMENYMFKRNSPLAWWEILLLVVGAIGSGILLWGLGRTVYSWTQAAEQAAPAMGAALSAFGTMMTVMPLMLMMFMMMQMFASLMSAFLR